MVMPNVFKKLTLIFLSSVLFLNSMVMPFAVANAQDEPPATWYAQNPVDWMVKVYDDTNPSEIFGERYTAAQTQWIVWGLMTLPFVFLGDTNRKAVICLLGFTTDGNSDMAACVPALEAVFKPIVDFFTSIVATNADKTPMAIMTDFDSRSFSGVAYVTSRLNKFGIIPSAQAQSTGYGYFALSENFSDYWAGMRDIAYALSVLAIIIFSFMIMFRVKISPQLVISVQSALPKVIVALILVTFSFAIAGFVIDLMYVVSGLFASMLVTAKFTTNWQDTYTWIMPATNTEWGLTIFVYMFIYFVLFLFAFLFAAITSIVSITGIIPGVLWSILMIGMLIWIFILMFWYAFKIPWILIKNLISIYVSIITATIQIMAGVIAPQIGFGLWLRKLVAEVLVYPVTGLFFYLAMKLLGSSMMFSIMNIKNILGIKDLIDAILTPFGGSFGSGIAWVPSIIGSADKIIPFFFMIASFGLIVAIPKVVDILKFAIMNAKFDFGTAMGEAAAPFTAAGLYTASSMSHSGTLPGPVGGLYTRLTGRTAPSSSASLRGLGTALEAFLKNFKP